jgi:ornithine carbamoyltransferase
MNVTIISPKGYWPKEQFLQKAQEIATQKNHTVTVTDDINAVTQADVVATDTWVSFWYDNEREQRLTDLKNYTITQDVMRKAKPDAIFMHCMPIYYGEEVTKEVAHGPQSVIIDEAENRLWVQMALLTILLR